MPAADADLALERTALKEWAVLVEAMARGDIIAMVRKGGIREQRSGFGVRHDRFLLYPTYFHEKVEELAPRLVHTLLASHEGRPGEGLVRIEYVAHVAAVWRVEDLESLRDVEGEHGLAWAAVASRFHYKSRPGVHVVAVRLSRLPAEVTVPELRRYAGCVSWVELDVGIDVASARAVVADDDFAQRLAPLREALGAPVRAGARDGAGPTRAEMHEGRD